MTAPRWRDRLVDDPTFEADLEASYGTVWVAARWLSRHGRTVTVPPQGHRDVGESEAPLSDEGDLRIRRGAQGTATIEVKHRLKLGFTTLAEFPWRTIIVDTVHYWDASDPKPFGYMIYNLPQTAFMWVPGNTRAEWVKEWRFDERLQRNRYFYECPIARCRVYPQGSA